MESLPSVQDYCKNGLFPSQGCAGKKFCSPLFVQAAKFDLVGFIWRSTAAMLKSLIGDVDFGIEPLNWPKAATMMRYL
ncbi:hypothetical protein FHT86_001684 [Rhizobium sp. BK313]|jgi:hypothetical protein|uniref:hypothetical protein n=1 Tax=Rhizobium sp. BK313 TaxID=2587081 RepID=UPI001061D2A1|nr:hypothetical protein [Rhizobium sp. BK313]MBB3453428.1 hypothetical protein [Rhizobium sp. BK313]